MIRPREKHEPFAVSHRPARADETQGITLKRIEPATNVHYPPQRSRIRVFRILECSNYSLVQSLMSDSMTSNEGT